MDCSCYWYKLLGHLPSFVYLKINTQPFEIVDQLSLSSINLKPNNYQHRIVVLGLCQKL